jgi:nicotinamidase-related amidase
MSAEKEGYMKRKKDEGRFSIGPGDAFMVVDMNKDMLFENGKLFVRGLPGEPSPQELVRLILEIDRLPFIFTFVVSDMHPPGHIESRIYREHSVKGTSGQEWPDELKELFERADFHLIKGMERELISVPLYTSRDFFRLIPLLRQRGIERIFSAGIAYDHCLGESAIALALQGFKVFVIRDATRSVPPPHGKAESMEKKLKLYKVKEIFSKRLL